MDEVKNENIDSFEQFDVQNIEHDNRQRSNRKERNRKYKNHKVASNNKVDVKAKLERSRQSARECRARKKLRYQYLEDLVRKRENANTILMNEIEQLKHVIGMFSKNKGKEEIEKRFNEIEKRFKQN